MKKIKLLIYLAIAGAIFTSCTKDGPAGPEGNANVTSDTFSIPAWSTYSYCYYYDFYTSKLTHDIANSGAVETYLSTDGGNNYITLPQIFYDTVNYWMRVRTEYDLVELQWWYNGSGNIGVSPNTYFGATCMVKAVYISASMRQNHPKVNWSNYQEMEQAISHNQ
jgi:hypothetical protein